ncbi:MAG: hypothetical protein HKN48_13620 [Flavobacteriaceae bacterium]|nr:hypothetical protein [Flavobacteriaceae bacterium]
MKPLVLLMLLVAFSVSCGNSEIEETTEQISNTDTALYGKKKFSFPNLTPNVKEVMENWSVFNDFQLEATTIHNLKLEELKMKSAKLMSFTDSLSKSIPDTLFTDAIRSRLIIVKTRASLLNQEANKNSLKDSIVEIHISETNLAIHNLMVQLNEKIQKDAIDMQRIDNEKKELEKQKKYLDSIYQLELQDVQNN